MPRVKRYHVERGAIEGNADIIDGSIPAKKLQTNAISFIIPILGIYERTGLAADSTGVKYEGPRFKIDTNGLKSAKIRATWTASETDSETAIELYDVTAGSVVGSVSGNAGTDVESDELKDAITSGNLFELRVNVTTASATAGATTDVKYAILELVYGYS
mgnify:CR=1 FL=1